MKLAIQWGSFGYLSWFCIPVGGKIPVLNICCFTIPQLCHAYPEHPKRNVTPIIPIKSSIAYHSDSTNIKTAWKNEDLKIIQIPKLWWLHSHYSIPCCAWFWTPIWCPAPPPWPGAAGHWPSPRPKTRRTPTCAWPLRGTPAPPGRASRNPLVGWR